jgi:lipid A 3-O-deacylase
MMKRLVLQITMLLILLYLLVGTGRAQNTRLLMFTLRIDEDYLNYRGKGSDRYYTGGFDFSFYYHSKKNRLLPALFIPPPNSQPVSFVSLQQLVNTPANLTATERNKNDYPYAGVLFVDYGKLFNDSAKSSRLTAELSVGIIGPYSCAQQIQQYFHRIIGDAQPNGWSTQIPTGLVFNYKLKIEKGLINYRKHIELNGNAEVNTGTTFNNCSVGLLFRTGKSLGYFSNYEIAGFNTKNNSKGRFVFFMQPQLTVVIYNEMLQGSLFKKRIGNVAEGAYVVKAEDISRLIVSFAFGFKYETKNAAISFSQHMQTREFNQVNGHEYGNISFVFKLNKKTDRFY